MAHARASSRRSSSRAGTACTVLSGFFVALSAGGCQGDFEDEPLASQQLPVGVEADATRVETAYGPVVGTAGTGYVSFKGVPFATPPVGALRWAPPRPPQPWTIPRDASQPGNRCAQRPPAPGAPGASEDEDCLYLNVTTPSTRPRGRRFPVLMYLHGGGFVTGSGADPDSRRMAVEGQVVVVTINYRLGLFGFLAHPALPDSGAFGLQDQVAALKWVKRNIAAFGGDPTNVTLGGLSAGGYATCALMTSPAAASLFEKAIIWSGACGVGSNSPDNLFLPGVPGGAPFRPRDEAEALGLSTAASVGCADPNTAAACLRGVPVAALLAQTPSLAVLPTYGTSVLPRDPNLVLRCGGYRARPVLIGGTRDEHRAFLSSLQARDPITAEDYRRMLEDVFGDRADLVAARYPVDAFESPAVAYAAVATDVIWSCPTLDNARQLARRAPTFLYEFADRGAPSPNFPSVPGLPMGAAHTTDLAYYFDRERPVTLTDEQRSLAASMVAYVTRFMATDDPNSRALPDWPRFPRAPRRDALALSLAPGDGGITPIDFGAQHKCDFWSAALD